MKKVILKLYVAGMTKTAITALENLNKVCDENIKDKNYSIEVIDIRKHPQLAEDEKIIATPTLIKLLPQPIRRIIGDLSEREQLLVGLDLIEL